MMVIAHNKIKLVNVDFSSQLYFINIGRGKEIIVTPAIGNKTFFVILRNEYPIWFLQNKNRTKPEIRVKIMVI